MYPRLFDNEEQNASFFANYQPPKQQAPAPKKKGNFVTNLLPTIGGTLGGVAGGAAAGTALMPGIGTLAGALIGGALGGGAGKVAENKLEGNNLGSGVAGAALENGVLSAGPIRLLKGAKAATTAVRGGETLASALAKGGAADAAAMGQSAVKTAVANKLADSGDNMIVKSFGIPKGAKNTYLIKTGERMSSVMNRYGIKKPEDIQNAVNPLFGEYNSIVSQIPNQFTKSDVTNAFKAVYEPMLAKGTPTGTQAMGQKLKEEAANMVKGIKGTITPAELNARRGAFDELAYKLKRTDPSLADVNKQSRDVLQGLLRSSADSAGLKSSNGLTLEQTGQEISKLKRLADAAGKNIEGAGGHMAIGLGSTPLAIVGSGGGPVGAAAGLALNMAANSPAGQRAISAGLKKGATAVTSSAEKTAVNPYSLTNVAKRTVPLGLAGALTQSSTSQDNAMSTTTNPTANNILPSQYDLQSANAIAPETQAPSSPFDPANVDSNIQQIVANGGTMKDVTNYVSLVQALTDIKKSSQPAAAKGLNSTASGVIADTKTGLNALSELSNGIAQSNANNPLIGQIRARNPFDTNAQTLQAQVATAKQIVGKALEGGVLRKEDEVKYAKLLPTMGDTDAVAQYKIAQLQKLIGQRLAEYQANLSGGSGGVDSASLGL